MPLLYVAAAVGGLGAGAVYGTCVGNALKWFPDRRGLAAGLTAAGFGAGSALTIIPIAAIIKSHGYEAAFFYFGIGQGLIVFLVAWWLAARAGEPEEPRRRPRCSRRRRDYTPAEVLRQPVFWVMYLMFVMVAAGGLMATAQLGPIAKDFKIADVPVSIMGLTLPALDLRARDRPRAQRPDASVLRLGVGPHRPRADDVHRLRGSKPSASLRSTSSATTRSRSWC